MDNPLDKKKTQDWALAPLASAGAIVGYATFGLVNRETGREHQLHLPTGGLQVGFSASGGPPSYTLFQTAAPVSFADFSGVGARMTSANIGVIYGYSIVILTLWKSAAYLSDQLAYVKMTGGSFMLPGGAVAHGVTKITYGSGATSGPVPRVLPSKDKFEPIQRWVKTVIIPKASTIQIPSDVLFEFNKYNINTAAKNTLLTLADVLNNRRKLEVRIEGHTDSMGSDSYNEGLALNRAKAVKDWFIRAKVYKAQDFITQGYGKRKPVAPNNLPGGRDNPAGRAKNRRVEIVLQGGIPSL